MNMSIYSLLVAQAMHNKKRKFKQEGITYKIDVPKSLRKGKTYEEILKIRKQIWEMQSEKNKSN
jgi:hypothetical protein